AASAPVYRKAWDWKRRSSSCGRRSPARHRRPASASRKRPPRPLPGGRRDRQMRTGMLSRFLGPFLRRAAAAAMAMACTAAFAMPGGAFELEPVEPAGSVLHGCRVKVQAGETVAVRLLAPTRPSGTAAPGVTVVLSGPGTTAVPLREQLSPDT